MFQDPFSSYNPIFKADRVFSMVRDSFYGDVSQSEWDGRVEQALRNVALDPDGVLTSDLDRRLDLTGRNS